MLVWRSFYRDRVRHGLVYAYMVWIWRFVFSTAVFDHLRVSAKPGECRRSIQNVPLVIESKCTTLGVLFSNWVSVFIARVKWGYGRQQPPVFQPKAVTCSP